MKMLYRCERCGRTSENYEEIVKCEQTHYTVTRPWYSEEGLNETLESMTEYKEGQEEPNVVHLVLERSYWEGDELKVEKRCGKFKLISSYEMPLVISEE